MPVADPEPWPTGGVPTGPGCVLGAMLMLAACRGASMSAAFLDLDAGLQLEHQHKTPFFEQVSCRVGDPCSATRIYPDGALYLEDLNDPSAPKWAYLTDVRPAGIAALASTFDALCRVSVPPERNANDHGSVTYRWENATCSREVLITGVSYGAYAPLVEVAGHINRNLVPGTGAATAQPR